MGILSKPNRRLRRTDGWLELALRWLLGGVFILASTHKILDPAAFAKIVYGYGLFPDASINLIAIVLPYIELTAGLALLLGVYPRAAAAILSGLLTAFILAIGFNALRGHTFDCGCFTSGETGLWPDAPAWLLARNAVLLIVGLGIASYRGPRRALIRSG